MLDQIVEFSCSCWQQLNAHKRSQEDLRVNNKSLDKQKKNKKTSDHTTSDSQTSDDKI